MEKIQSTGLNKDAFNSFNSDIQDLAVDIYNERYGTTYQPTDTNTSDFPQAFIAVTLYGMGEASKYSEESQARLKAIFGKDSDYQGIDATTKKSLALADGDKDKIDKIFLQRKQEIFAGIFFGLYRYYEETLSKVDKKNYVGAISKRDNRVRPAHRRNDGKFWQVGKYRPWLDYNCRCDYYYFTTADEAKKAGYKLIAL